ncbi:hypothetical protein B0A55_09049 [Friedmanniomyces simplex]|uniref:Uncharacterized protein n=1 Tax=Friedmanniomyces simplex TaxID=329884 RepID=A0A4U0WVT6_9PEZI|nr:hypothetical protein B0A55_09049 [Friedmanniomyces simplex]
MDYLRSVQKRLPSAEQLPTLKSLQHMSLRDASKKLPQRLAFFRKRIRIRGNSKFSVPLYLVLLFPVLVLIIILLLFVRHPNSPGGRLIPAGAPPSIRKINEKHDKVFVTGCLDPKVQQDAPRANAAFVVLARNKELDGVVESLKSQLAKTVMRRDLAICRERSGQEAPSLVAPVATVELAPGSNGDPKAVEAESTPVNFEISTDVEMQDPEPAAPETHKEPPVEVRPEKANSEEAQTSTIKGLAQPSPDKKPPPDNADADFKTSVDERLKVDTSTEYPSQPKDPLHDHADTDNKPPDTATMSEGQDLESLFNDPISAGGSGDTTTGPATGTGTGEDPNDPTDFTAGFDFGTFNASLDTSNAMDTDDNITALLPGLQDYANTQPIGTEAEEPDFNALFATDAPLDGEVDAQQAAEQRDSTFDDIMNFAEFNGSEYTGGGGGEGGGGDGADFDDFNFD